jgi:TonB family protein
MKQTLLGVLCAVCAFGAGPLVHAQDRVVVAGQDGVAAPKRTKVLKPIYPQEALAQGVRGIVILEILIDTQGKVASAEVIRSIPLLDEAALGAVRKWEYEVTKVGGQPVSVKLTVPITFALTLPEVTRAPGIPELRQGTGVVFPPGASEGSSVTAQVTLAPDGQVAEVDDVKGSAPFTVALLQALRTWRFAPEGENVILTFQVEATFAPPGRGDKGRVEVRLGSLRRSESVGAPPSTTADLRANPAPDVPPAPVEPTAVAPSSPVAGEPAAPSAPPPVAAPPAATSTIAPTSEAVPPGPATAVPAVPPAEKPSAPTSPAQVAAPASAPPVGSAAPPSTPAAGPPAPEAARPGTPAVAPKSTSPPPPTRSAPAPPPVEVLSAPVPPGGSDANVAPPLPGVSAVKDVTLALGVPDLVRGRRPVPPPLARMSGTTGSVEVKFGVDAAGATSVAEIAGPEPLKTAAAYTVQSWLFRRITVERLHLVASFDFADETAKVSVRPE